METQPAVEHHKKNHSSPITNHQSQSSKRSKVMNTIKTGRRFLVAFVAMLFSASIALSQGNFTNTGTYHNTGTLKVKSFSNSGASAAFDNTATGSSLHVNVDLNTTTSGALAANFDVTKGFVHFGPGATSAVTDQVKTATYQKLSVGGANRSIAGTITVSDSITADAATVALGSNTLHLNNATIASPVNPVNAGAFTFTSGTVDYAGGSQHVYSGSNYAGLTVNGTGSKDLAGDISVTSALTVTASDLAISGHTLTLDGTVSVSGTLTGSSTSNITFGGSGSATLPTVASGLGNLTINRGASDQISLSGASGSLNLQGATSLTLTQGILNVGTTYTLTLHGDATKTANGSLTSASDGTVSYAKGSVGQAVIAANYGNLTFDNFNKAVTGVVGIAGTLTPGTATGHTLTTTTFTFNGAGQSIPRFNWDGTTGAGYQDVTTSGSTVTKTLAATVKLSGAFTNGGTVVTDFGQSGGLVGYSSIVNTGATIKVGGASNGVSFGSTAATGGIVLYSADATDGGSPPAAQDVTTGSYYQLQFTGDKPKNIANNSVVATGAGVTLGTNVNLTLVTGGTGSSLTVGTGGLSLNASGAQLNNNSTITGTSITVTAGGMTLASGTTVNNGATMDITGDVTNGGTISNTGTMIVN
jgi:mucin-19